MPRPGATPRRAGRPPTTRLGPTPRSKFHAARRGPSPAAAGLARARAGGALSLPRACPAPRPRARQ
eukprot:9636790-Lingulodinium_polyedra.AAC.1